MLGITVFIIACDKDDPEIPNEEELITTVNYFLTPTDGGQVVTLTFRDLDGDGGQNPTITEGTLTANHSYMGRLELLNESETPTEDITEEIKAEDKDHQFFFQSSISDLTFAYTDMDADGNPVGLTGTLTTGAAGTGTMTIILIHKPEKEGTGVSDGDVTNAQGETDIQITFPLIVE